MIQNTKSQSFMDNDLSNELFLTVFDESFDPIVIVDVSDAKILRANVKAQSVYGYTDEEFKKISIGDIDVEDSMEVIKRRSQKIMALGWDQFETKHKTKEAKLLDVLVRVKVIEIDHVAFLLATFHDITKEKSHKKTLEEEKEKYALFLENATDGIFIMSPSSGDIIEVNQMAAKLLGYSVDELKKLNVTDWDKNITDEKYQELMHVLEYTGVHTFNTVHTRKDGSSYIASITANIININKESFVYASVRDVTETETLKARYLALFNDAPDAYFIMELDGGKISDCNKAAEKMLGGTREQIIGVMPDQLSPQFQPNGELSQKLVTERITESIRDGYNNFEWVHKRFNGEEFWANVTVSTLHTGDRTVMFVAWRDISDNVAKNEQLQRSRESLNRAQAIAHIGNWEFDLTKNELFWSDEIYKIFEIDKTKFQPSYEKFLDAIHPEDRKMVNEAYTEAVRSRSLYQIKHRLLIEDRIKYVEERAEHIFDENGNITKSLGTVQDITQLVLKEQEFEAIFKNSKDGLAIVDNESNFIDFNAAYTDMTGYERNELLKKSCISITISQDLPKVEEAWQQAIEIGYVTNVEKSCFKKDGSVLTANISIVKMPDNKHFLLSSKDVTQEKENRDKIQKLLSEQQSLLTLFDKGDSVLFRWNNDATFSIDYVSSNVSNLLGYTQEDFFNGITYSSLIHKDDIKQVLEEIVSGTKSKENFIRHKLYRVITKNKQTKWVLDYKVLVKDVFGNITHYLGYLLDLTDYIKKQKELDDAQERFALAKDGTKDGIWDWNVITNEVYFSPRWKEMLGYDADELPEELSTWSENVHPDDIEAAYANVNAHLSGKTDFYENEHRMKHKDGHWVWILDRGKAVFDKNGKAYRMLGFHTDVSERKKLEEELVKEKDFVSTIINTANAIVAVIDANGVMQRMNKYAEDFTGYTQKEVSQEPYFWARFLNASVKETVTDIIAQANQGNIVHSFRNTWLSKNGEERMFEWANQLIKNADGGMDFMFTIGIDITDKIKIEQELAELNQNLQNEVTKQVTELRDKEQMLIQQSKLAAMGEMIGAIAHQWRQPLNVLSTGIQNLEYDYEDGFVTKEFIENFIEDKKRTINFMSKTIDDFRLFFRTDKEKKAFDLQEAVKSVLNMQSAQLNSHQIKIEFKGESAMYIGIQSELQQVILNLLNNAKDVLIEQNRENPKITIQVQSDKIIISDNGGGIPDAVKDRIFEPYFTTKDEGKGTGMGLYMSKTIVENNLGGKLSAVNDTYGAVFTIELR